MYVSSAALGNADFVQHIRDLLQNTELNAVVMDCGDTERSDVHIPARVVRPQARPEDCKSLHDRHGVPYTAYVFYRYIGTKTLDQSNSS
jgi:hypothetical protein